MRANPHANRQLNMYVSDTRNEVFRNFEADFFFPCYTGLVSGIPWLTLMPPRCLMSILMVNSDSALYFRDIKQLAGLAFPAREVFSVVENV